jgi:hypothetical protein
MAQRARAVRPDQAFEKEDGQVIGVVSLELMIEEVVRAVTTQDFSGGVLQIVVNRHPTGVPNEMVTVGALIQWQDRTDAKPQPEPAAPAQTIEPEVQEEIGGTKPGLRSATQEVRRPRWTYDPEPDELERQLEQEAREEHDDVPLPQEAVVVGAPVGAEVGPQDYETPIVRETPVTHTRPPREAGVGAGALPFQRGGEAGAPVEINLDDVVSGSNVPDPKSVPASGRRCSRSGRGSGRSRTASAGTSRRTARSAISSTAASGSSGTRGRRPGPRDRDGVIYDAKKHWGSHLHIPLTYRTIEHMVPAAIAHAPKMLYLPRLERFAPNVRNVQLLMDAQMQQADIELPFQDVFKAGLMYGLGVGKSLWREEYGLERKTRRSMFNGRPATCRAKKLSQVCTYNDPWFEDVDVFDFAWDAVRRGPADVQVGRAPVVARAGRLPRADPDGSTGTAEGARGVGRGGAAGAGRRVADEVRRCVAVADGGVGVRVVPDAGDGARRADPRAVGVPRRCSACSACWTGSTW